MIVETPHGLGWHEPEQYKHPFVLNFTAPSLLKRIQLAPFHKEPLIKALGIKGSPDSGKVWDVMGGWLSDTLVMLAMGYHVQVTEASPMVVMLVEDALNRAQSHPDLAPMLERLDYRGQSFESCLATLSPDIQHAYVDPMYETKAHTHAKSSKDMQVLQSIGVSTDGADSPILPQLLNTHLKRVVVKRPLKAPHLDGLSPQATWKGKHTRFDAYLNPS